MSLKKQKKQYYNKQIPNSNNKIKTIWNITKLVTGNSTVNDDICQLKSSGNMINNTQGIADFFNSYFLTIVDNNLKNTSLVNNNNIPLHYLQQAFHCPFPHIKHQAVTSAEITKIIQSLKNKDSNG
jgi:hypothetical protein